MIDLLKTMTVEQIIIFVFIIALAVKEVINLVDFFAGKNKKAFEKAKENEEILKKLDETSQKLDAIKNHFEEVTKRHEEKIDLLVLSDKDDIKAYITNRFHHFTELGYIDDFSMDVLERRFEHYVAEGGNSFIEAMMGQLRALPRK